MSIKQFELFHGAVLTRLMRNKRPMTLRLIETNANEAWAAYVINDALAILIKYSASPQAGKGRRGRTYSLNLTRCVCHS